MAERRPDLAREHRLHDRFRGPPAAEGLTGQVPGVAAGRSNVARLGARGASGRMPLPRAGRPTARAVKASAPLQTAARRPLVVVVAATPNYLRQASQNLGKYRVYCPYTVLCTRLVCVSPRARARARDGRADAQPGDARRGERGAQSARALRSTTREAEIRGGLLIRGGRERKRGRPYTTTSYGPGSSGGYTSPDQGKPA